MGYYPSNQEIDDMINEIKYSRFAQGNGQDVTEINLNDMIKLYLNHRPILPPTQEDIEIALSHAKRLEPGKPSPLGPVIKMSAKEMVKTDGLYALLGQFGINF